jgi:DNA-binding Lrp family transcriptional regulator
MTVLARDGRASAVEIAAETGTHPTTVARHLRQACETGLLALRCELAQDWSGYPIGCSYRTLRLCAATTGDANLTFYLWLRTPGAIADVEAGLQQAAPAVQVIESDVGVRTHKRTGWMLNEDSTATGEVIVTPVLPPAPPLHDHRRH